MVGGAVVSILVVAVGAILDFAVTVSPYEHGFNIRTVGVILMIMGGIGFVVSLLGFAFAGGGYRRRRTTVDDGRGNVMRREDTYL
jgi:hypothetical protein